MAAVMNTTTKPGVQPNPVVRLSRDGRLITAHFANGDRMSWCNCATERGAKSRLSHHAKRLGFVVAGNEAVSAL